jgi:hypothetical protein
VDRVQRVKAPQSIAESIAATGRELHVPVTIEHCDHVKGPFFHGTEHAFEVEPTGPFEDDPNVTNKRSAGNPTRSFRTRHPMRVIGEVQDWPGHPPEVLHGMLDSLARLREEGLDLIED